MNHSVSLSAWLITLFLCATAGLFGGLVLMTVTSATWITGPVFGVVYGLLFVLLFSKHTTGAGSGLLWGLGYALLLWLAAVTGPLVISAGARESRRVSDESRQLSGPRRLRALLRRTSGVNSWIADGEVCRRRAVQHWKSHGSWDASRPCRRMGIRQVDGAGEFLSIDRGLDGLSFADAW